MAAAAVLLLAAAVVGGLTLRGAIVTRGAAVAREEAHDDIRGAEEALERGDVCNAFTLLSSAVQVLPGYPEVDALMERASCTWTVDVSLSNAIVTVRQYGDTETPWQRIREFPCRLPRFEHFWKVEKDGYVVAKGCAGPGDVHLKPALARSGEMPSDMVLVKASTGSGRDIAIQVDRSTSPVR